MTICIRGGRGCRVFHLRNRNFWKFVNLPMGQRQAFVLNVVSFYRKESYGPLTKTQLTIIRRYDLAIWSCCLPKDLIQMQNCETGDDLDRTAGNELVGAQETYYDGEFYQALLTEFLEGSSDQVADHKIHKEPKNRKIVDRRASKGRKIRYHVHEKLVNFMAPDEAELPEYASRIFANLFGHKRQPEE